MSRSVRTCVVTVALAAGLALAPGQPALSHTSAIAAASDVATVRNADFRGAALPSNVRGIAQWAVQTADHQGLPFIVVDKVSAMAAAFDARGRFIRSTPVLLGMGVGDTWAPGVLQMEMHQTQPWQRITPAGRFVADEDRNDKGQRVLWVDYDAGIALHRLPSRNTQRRHERIRSPDPAVRRITYGCINVPGAFYDQVVHPNFRRKGGIVYVLPDVDPVNTVFRSYDGGKSLETAAARSGGNPAAPAVRQ